MKQVPARKAPAAKALPAGVGAPVSREERWRMVAEAAYYRARQRNFAGGDERADWLDAERQVDEQLAREGRTPAAG
ncbi:MAG: DUF2934 domain-containing protein [Burkholderiales bacterium]